MIPDEGSLSELIQVRPDALICEITNKSLAEGVLDAVFTFQIHGNRMTAHISKVIPNAKTNRTRPSSLKY
ncbi:hypothetical protein INT45_009623 [Circinella minor]|uniref:Uncharacterized protein n=1 Tax=Circinella minor TaxID=1195481 RepID=A0A8H7S975_9FUNG|nr:hypothetical protein INT45_009623 [Circinella minor]